MSERINFFLVKGGFIKNPRSPRFGLRSPHWSMFTLPDLCRVISILPYYMLRGFTSSFFSPETMTIPVVIEGVGLSGS